MPANLEKSSPLHPYYVRLGPIFGLQKRLPHPCTHYRTRGSIDAGCMDGIRFQGKHVLRDVRVVQREREQGGWVQVA